MPGGAEAGRLLAQNVEAVREAVQEMFHWASLQRESPQVAPAAANATGRAGGLMGGKSGPRKPVDPGGVNRRGSTPTELFLEGVRVWEPGIW